MVLVAPGETTSPLHPKTPSQMKETKSQISVGGVQQENENQDLPCPDHDHPPQGWLLCRVSPPSQATEGALPLLLPEGADYHRHLNPHSTIGHDHRSHDSPIQFGLVSDRHRLPCLTMHGEFSLPVRKFATQARGEVAGINNGLEIKGTGTFKFKVDDDDGKTHEIKIPNSLYLPDLKKCLLSPQHWA
jgi:hypothetical protein